MKLKCKVIKQVFKCSNYQILGCIPLDNNNQIMLNKYGNFSIKDSMLILSEGKEYTVEIEETEFKGNKSYVLKSVPSMQIDDIKSITDEMEREILYEITSPDLAEQINKSYPNYVRMILQGEQDDIDLKKIKGVKEVRHALFVRLINEKFKYYYIIEKNRQYELELKDCKELCKLYPTVEKVNDLLDKKPYFALIKLCGRSFDRADRILKEARPDLLESDQRVEFLMLDVLTRNEYDGSTYMNANVMAQYTAEVDRNLTKKLKEVAIKSELIFYDDETKNIAKLETYLAECRIADFIKDRLTNSSKLDWDWHKFTEIKDGTLTEEQSNVLKTFCEHNFCVLDAPSGTGKTSVLKAILDMCDEYDYSYCCLAFTGKASARMSEQTGRPSSTIHRKTLSGSIYEDVLIIDEYSMLSIDLMIMIINAIENKNIRVFFVGDSCQIPSLGIGRIAKDLLGSPDVPTCTLTHCFRFAKGGADYVSTLTRQGKFYLTEEQCEQDKVILGEDKDYIFIKSDGTVEQVVDTYMELINKGVKKEDICVLSPYNKYDFGATNINNLIQLEVNPPKPNENIMQSKQNKTDITFRKGDLIMNIKNDYNAISLDSYNLMWDEDVTEEEVPKTSIFNGQIGKVLSINDNVLNAQIDEDIIVFDKIKCYNLLLSYSTNPFKFQGSSCKYIINLVLPQHKRLLNRQLLYTAQTRQEQCLIEIGDIETIKETINTLGDENRQTLLKELLN